MAVVISSLVEEIDRFVEAELSSDLLVFVFVFVIDGESVGGAEGERCCGFSTCKGVSWRGREAASMAEKGVRMAMRSKKGWSGGGNTEGWKRSHW